MAFDQRRWFSTPRRYRERQTGRPPCPNLSATLPPIMYKLAPTHLGVFPTLLPLPRSHAIWQHCMAETGARRALTSPKELIPTVCLSVCHTLGILHTTSGETTTRTLINPIKALALHPRRCGSDLSDKRSGFARPCPLEPRLDLFLRRSVTKTNDAHRPSLGRLSGSFRV